MKIEGLTALIQDINSLKATGSQLRAVVQKNGAKLQSKTQDNMLKTYQGHYEGKKFVKPTGTTRRSTTLEIENGGLTAIVAPGTKYFPYLEYGTRFMDARPTLTPAFNMVSQLFESDIKALFDD